eukprot:TRINITY_DN3031_c0_g2_i3.p1 TRINITY_DN3031_c0_g2~~TRINITY_DN3031_c0_g2_i3.p1  ORF type:complete len:308 (+),score=13.57 TRINITY_DN3031_c0_g2_i3:108-926(+)
MSSQQSFSRIFKWLRGLLGSTAVINALSFITLFPSCVNVDAQEPNAITFFVVKALTMFVVAPTVFLYSREMANVLESHLQSMSPAFAPVPSSQSPGLQGITTMRRSPQHERQLKLVTDLRVQGRQLCQSGLFVAFICIPYISWRTARLVSGIYITILLNLAGSFQMAVLLSFLRTSSSEAGAEAQASLTNTTTIAPATTRTARTRAGSDPLTRGEDGNFTMLTQEPSQVQVMVDATPPRDSPSEGEWEVSRERADSDHPHAVSPQTRRRELD